MVGILVATHGEMAPGIYDSVRMIMGEQEQFNVMSLLEGQDVEEFGLEMAEYIEKIDTGKGVLVLVDLFSASPYNQAALNKSKVKKVDYRIVSGVNLPMVLEVVGMRMSGMELEELTQTAMKAGQEGIKNFEFELANYKK